MVALFWSLWHATDFGRQVAKFGTALLIASVVALASLEAIIVAWQQTLFSPLVAIIGLIWITSTATTLWFRGTFIADKLLILGLFEIEPGKAVLQAITIFFVFESSVVALFFFVPVWQFWPGLLILPTLIFGLMLSGSLSKKTFNWESVQNFYLIAGSLMIALMFFLAGQSFLTGQKITGVHLSPAIQSRNWTLFLIGLFILFIGFIPRMAAKEKWRIVGSFFLILGWLYAYQTDPLKIFEDFGDIFTTTSATGNLDKLQIIPTRVVLAPGEIIGVVHQKGYSRPKVIIAFSQTQYREIPQKFWEDNRLIYEFRAANSTEKSATVFLAFPIGQAHAFYDFQKYSIGKDGKYEQARN